MAQDSLHFAEQRIGFYNRKSIERTHRDIYDNIK